MDILRAKVERDEGQKRTAANARGAFRKSRGGGGGESEKRKKDENVLVPSSKKPKVHPYHRADEDEYSD